MIKMKSIFLCGTLAIVLSVIAVPSDAVECWEDTLSDRSNGEILQTRSGKIFEPLLGDRITAKFWMRLSDLLVCGPIYFEYQGKKYEYYEISNTDDGEKISARAIGQTRGSSRQPSTGCYRSSITKPVPFMGNNDEIFVLADGSIWQIKYEYEYMYEYYPAVVACPDAGYVIVEGKKLNAEVLR